MTEKNVAEMNSTELGKYIELSDARHKRIINALRALMRVREAEEAVDVPAEE